MADLLQQRWPMLAAQIETALRSADEQALAELVPELRVVAQCSCKDDFCQSFYTASPPDRAYGSGHRNVVLDAPWPGYLILDVVDDDVMYVEVLYRVPLN